MVERSITPSEAEDLRQIMHVAVLDALIASRRWGPGELVFQGGTALHLVHGSPRYSEDVDFLVLSSINLDAIAESIRERLAHAAWLPRDAKLTVGNARDARNPHAFDVTLSGKQLIGSVRVRVELRQASAKALSGLQIRVLPLRDARSGLQTFVPAATVHEIHTDKVFALAARPNLKPRDVFDLHWLHQHHPELRCTLADLRARFATYPNMTPDIWRAKATERIKELERSAGPIAKDLARWLPSSVPMTPKQSLPMIAVCVEALTEALRLLSPARHPH